MSWLALDLAIELEVSGKTIYAYTDSFLLLESLRSLRGLPLVEFYTHLWVSTLHTLSKSEPGTALWFRIRDYMLVKLPILMSSWKKMESKAAHPPTFESTSQDVENIDSVDKRAVENSILAASRHKFLCKRLNFADEITEEMFDPVDAIIFACIVRKIVDKEVMVELFPERQIRVPIPSSSNLVTLEEIISGTIPRTKEDVDIMKKLINPQLVLNDKNQALLDSICTSMCKKWDIQEHIVDLLFTVLDRDSHIDVGLVVHLLAHLSNTRVLDVLYTHGRILQLIAYLAQYCDEWGMAPPDRKGISRHHHFGTAYLMLVQTLELFDLKHHPYNNPVLHNSLRSIANRSSSDFVTPVYASTVLVPLSGNQTLFPFWEWYRNYMYSITTCSPYASKASTNSTDPAHTNQVPLTDTILEVLFNIPSTFHTFISTVSPWQLLMESSNIICKLYQACLYFGMTMDRLVSTITPMALHTPHCVAEMMHWLAEEVQKGYIDESTTPLPFAILGSISEIEVPALVVETISLRTAPILERWKVQFKILDTILPKYKGRRLAQRIPPPPNPLPTPLQPAGTIINKIVTLILNDTFPPSISLTHILELLHGVLLRVGENNFTTFMCKEVFDIILNLKGNAASSSPSEANAIRFAEVCGFFMGVIGSSRTVSVLLTEKIPSLLPLLTTAFQAKSLAHFAIISLIFSGMLHSPVFVSQIEESMGLVGPFALVYLHELILFQAEEQRTIVTPSSAFSISLLSTYLALPLIRSAVIDPLISRKLVQVLMLIGYPDLALALLDMRKPADRAFVAKVFGVPDLEKMVLSE